MAGYLGNIPTPQATQTRDTFTATSGQTSFATSGYTVGGQMLDVYLNGIKLIEGSANDFTATNGSDVVLTSGASAGDILEVVSFSTFETNSGVFTGDFSVDSPTFKVDSSNNRIGLGTASPTAQLHIVGDDTSNQVIIENTDTSNSSAPDLMLLRKSTSSAADNDVIGRIDFAGLNDANEQINYFTISARIDDNTDGTENGMLRLQHIKDGSYVEPVVIDGTGGLRVGLDTNIFNTASTEKASFKNTTTGGALTLQATDVTGGYPILWLYSSDTTTSQNAIIFQRTGGAVGTITTTASATAYNTSSDYRLKENVSYTWDATARLKQLKPARFNFIADADTIVDGFLAHEVSNIVPEAVTGTKDEVDSNDNPIMQGIDQSKLVPLLVKTIQELEARITALEAK